jgi:hypothetical protein
VFAAPAKASELPAVVLALLIAAAVPAQAADARVCARIASNVREGVVLDALERTAFRVQPTTEGDDAILRRLKSLLRESFMGSRPGTVDWSGARTARIGCGGRPVALLTLAEDAVRVLPAEPTRTVAASAPEDVVHHYEKLRESRALTVAELEQWRTAALKLGRIDEAAALAQEIFRCRAGWVTCN